MEGVQKYISAKKLFPFFSVERIGNCILCAADTVDSFGHFALKTFDGEKTF